MSKTKPAKGDAAKLSKKDSKKTALSAVKDGRVTKPAQTPKVKSKEIAKSAATSHGVSEELKKKKKSKKAKTPTPEPESESESESESEASASDSESSASESEDDAASDSSSASSSEDEEVEAKAPAKAKANGVGKPAAKVEADDSSSASSDSSDEEEGSDSDSDSESGSEEAAAPKANGVKANGSSKPAAKEDSDSSSDSAESDSESESEEPAAKAKDTTKKAAKADTSSDEDSGSDDSASDSDSSTSESEEEEEEEEEEEAPSKKRKAETTAEPAVKRTKTEAADEGIKNLFVGNLSWNVDEEWLGREFEQFGEIIGCRIITDRETQRPKGFGYVEFASSESAKNAKEQMHQKELDGRPMNVDFSTPRQNNQNPKDKSNNRAQRFGDRRSAPSNTLFIGNLSFDSTNDSIHEIFSQHGEITRVSLPTDRETGTPKGFGYVDFSSVDEAKSALEALNGTDVNGRSIRIDFAAARDNNGGGGGGGRGGFGGRGGGFGGRGGGRGGRGGARGGRGGTTNRGGFNDFKGTKVSF